MSSCTPRHQNQGSGPKRTNREHAPRRPNVPAPNATPLRRLLVRPKQLPNLNIKASGKAYKRFQLGVAIAVLNMIQLWATNASGQAELELAQSGSFPPAADVLAQNMLDARFHALSVRVLPENTVNCSLQSYVLHNFDVRHLSHFGAANGYTRREATVRIIDMNQALRGSRLVAVGLSAGFCVGAQGESGLFYEDERDLLNRMAAQGRRVVALLDDTPPLRAQATAEPAQVDYAWVSPESLHVPSFPVARGEVLAALCHRRSLRMGDVAYIATSPLDREVAMGAGRVLALVEAGDEVRRMADVVLPARSAGGLVLALLRARAFSPKQRDRN